MEQGRTPFRFLTDLEFSLLDAETKAGYLLEATKAIAAMTAEITEHVKRRADEIQGKH
jgi:hypothetical protein